MRGLSLHACIALAMVLSTGCTPNVEWPELHTTIEVAFPMVEPLTTDSLATWLEDASLPPPLLLDVRTEEEYRVSHLRNAIRVDPGATDFTFLENLPRDTPIVTYCSVGFRSADLAQRLIDNGYMDVVTLQGALFNWANEGRAIYRGDEVVQEVHPHDRRWWSLLQKSLRSP